MNAASGLLHPFPEWDGRLAAAFTTRGLPPGARPLDAYDRLNLGFRSGGDVDRAADNWGQVLAAEGLEGKPLVLPRMIHGDAWADADALKDPIPFNPAPSRPGFAAWEPEGCDALAAGVRGRVLAVTMADCLTALVWDPESSTIAAVHAGWRGTRARILQKILRSLSDAGRLKPASAWVAFGPCLRPQSLAVGPEVAAQLDPRSSSPMPAGSISTCRRTIARKRWNAGSPRNISAIWAAIPFPNPDGTSRTGAMARLRDASPRSSACVERRLPARYPLQTIPQLLILSASAEPDRRGPITRRNHESSVD